MSVAIRVQNLTKEFRIGRNRAPYRTLRESLVQAFTNPFRRLAGRGEDRQETIQALKDVSFEIPAGEVVGIIGRNGAGKSTLLKILSRTTEPTTGRIEFRGRLGSLLEVGTGFHPELTGRENIYLNGSILGMKRWEIQKKFDEIVAFAEIEKFLDTPVKRYSSGMYVRLGFAVAAHLEPEILVVDEVLAVGDSAFQKKCIGKMGDIAHRGRTVLLVSHNMHVIRNLCERAYLLVQGRLADQGHAADVVERYLADRKAGNAQVSWTENEAPSSAYMRLRSVSISGPDNVPSTTLRVDHEIRITYEFDVLQDVERGFGALWIKQIDGTEVLSTCSLPLFTTTQDEYCGKPMKKGRYVTTCCIPAEFLNARVYTITAHLGANVLPTQVVVPEVITFETIDTSQMRQEHLGHWLGAVRPRLPWETKKLD
jgi:homopolymeric O-antigen transport system ATP-binding protein